MAEPTPAAPPAATPPAGTPAAATPPASNATPPAAAAPATTPPADAQAELATLRARAEAAEAEAARNRAAAAEAEQLRAEKTAAETKRLQEQGEWKTLAERAQGELVMKNQEILRERVRSSAILAGAIDGRVVELMPVGEDLMSGGKPDQAKIDAAITAFKTANGHFFKAPPAAPAATGAGATPPAAAPTTNKYDFTKTASRADAERLFSEAKQGLRH